MDGASGIMRQNVGAIIFLGIVQFGYAADPPRL
jgi:hypothetical protein